MSVGGGGEGWKLQGVIQAQVIISEGHKSEWKLYSTNEGPLPFCSLAQNVKLNVKNFV